MNKNGLEVRDDRRSSYEIIYVISFLERRHALDENNLRGTKHQKFQLVAISHHWVVKWPPADPVLAAEAAANDCFRSRFPDRV